MDFQMFKMDLEKAEEPEIKLLISAGSSKKQGSSRKKKNKKKNFCFIDYAKAFDYMDHHKLWKILQEMGIPDHITCLLRNLDMEQQTGLESEKEYIKAVYCHPSYLTYMQSTSW